MKKYRIGFLGAYRAYGYGLNLLYGVRNAVIEQGHTFVLMSTQVPYHVNGQEADYLRLATEIIRHSDVDVLVIPVGALYQLGFKGESAERIAHWFSRLNPDNTLLLERDAPGFRSVTKDNAPGMRECIRHLIETRGYKKIAFVSGPAESRGAREREQVYFDEMKAHGLETPERLFTRGVFAGTSDDVILDLIDNNPDIEAIACANDNLAYSAYRALRLRGVRIGVDVAVTGFDDLPEAVQADPPLSSVRMTSYDLGFIGGYEAVRLAEGKPQKVKVQESRFIERTSSGGNHMSVTARFAEVLAQSPTPIEAIVSEFMDTVYIPIGGELHRHFEFLMTQFIEYTVANFVRYDTASRDEGNPPQADEHLFTHHSVYKIIEDKRSREYFHLESFQTMTNALLIAMSKVASAATERWLLKETAEFHLLISRIQGEAHVNQIYKKSEQTVFTLQLEDNALSSYGSDADKIGAMLGEMKKIGVHYAKLFTFQSPVHFFDVEDIQLHHDLIYRGSLAGDEISCPEDLSTIVSLRNIFTFCDESDKLPDLLTMSFLVANDEIVGVLLLDAANTDYIDQVSIFMMCGFSMKHLQLMAHEQEMIDMLNESNVMLTNQAQQDEMTGLLNRRGFFTMTEIFLRNNAGKAAAVFYLDLDGLKTINDTYGHDIGDDAIKNTAEILSACFRSTDVLCRQGGDEFTAFSLFKDEADATILIERVRQKVKEFNETHDLCYELSISVGVKAFTIDEHALEHFDHYLGEADEMLYNEKRGKKNSRRG